MARVPPSRYLRHPGKTARDRGRLRPSSRISQPIRSCQAENALIVGIRGNLFCSTSHFLPRHACPMCFDCDGIVSPAFSRLLLTFRIVTRPDGHECRVITSPEWLTTSWTEFPDARMVGFFGAEFSRDVLGH